MGPEPRERNAGMSPELEEVLGKRKGGGGEREGGKRKRRKTKGK